ncbi:N-acetylmannosamine-6-phosphate 2-epimerase [Mycolicibacterium wolinskyi]|uniref:Putative N-acetylmannosamine-6-phosphate 2-epimerase n=1 Tax=Mycolicibacterium wolinskyi TaxID=59750 RepID=A0A1X2FDA8_9MYCO|nr:MULTISPECIES: N-acetylmannosamine-6-phosphate 2-epimerase [Mycolicibacterium]MCV7289258.1 N-acetylmannosamine-6-phosphate 2-epimerase [Mycolicibacterium wolinskyi]MCV7294285.1 N-acetylmannosamine-6-phosphate 2-epimerase [Mycolicibacterium goodii]ORX16433.1 N-acetylmannosamine-6-phosphate 2-epimerase [Mycolicibacterium wolinskyi]
MTDVIDALAGGLIVSCQAYPGEPLRHPDTMARMADAVVAGGAVGIRAEGVDDISTIKSRTTVPLIGLWKEGTDGVFITPTLRHATAVREAGADIVALDGTRRARPDGRTLAATITRLRDSAPTVVMADCASLDDALVARDAGADVIGTTLAGYTEYRPMTDGPDLDLLAQLVSRLPDVPIIAEGRVHTPAQARAALDTGAYAVVVGTAITHPTTITGWFRQALTAD